MDEHIQTISKWLGAGSINIFGLPFAGKDTQGRKLAELFGGVMVSGGDILRHYPNQDEIQQSMASGGIIPSDLFEKIVLPYLSKQEFSGKPLILSEVGRVSGEDAVIYKATADSGHPTKAVVLLKLSDEQVWQRFEQSQLDHDRGQRADDNRDVIETRLINYHEKVVPVLEFYKQKGLLIEVDGSLTREQVTSEILTNLATFATR